MFSSYLHRRKSKAVIEVWFGVPQGSHLGPFIFAFVNEFSLILELELLLFADDLELFNLWLSWWWLLWWFSRTFYSFALSHHIKAVNHENFRAVRDLGVVFNSKINFCSPPWCCWSALIYFKTTQGLMYDFVWILMQ